MSYLQSIKHVFFDNAGNALENAYIYIGQPDTDPRTNPKTVTFEDSSGAQFTAAQPLRTLGGKIVYNGRPITAIVDGEHSMLILNSAGVQIEYTASIAPSSGSGSVDLSDTIRVGLTLDAVKGFDVAVGDVVRSVGRLTATDSLGADWLVISATGSPGDDVDLIDFDNGLQGQRDISKIYRSAKQVWSGSATSVNVNDLSDTTAGIYFVSASIILSTQFSFATRIDLSSLTQPIIGTSLPLASDVGGGEYTVGGVSCRIVLSGPNKLIKVTSIYLEIDSAGPTFNAVEQDATITAIYKV